jgi:protein TonB
VAPAEAAAVITRAAESPVDLTSATFATGHASVFPGGETAGAGRSTAPVAGAVDLAGRASATVRDATGGGLGRARAVRLAAGTWACPWPVEADSAQIDAQIVVIRVRVRPAGGVDEVEVVSDPGAGFGVAAAACARQTHFEPAHDVTGAPIAAWSPPIHVHFSR